MVIAGCRVSAGGHPFGPGGSVVKDDGALPLDVDGCGGVVLL